MRKRLGKRAVSPDGAREVIHTIRFSDKEHELISLVAEDKGINISHFEAEAIIGVAVRHAKKFGIDSDYMIDLGKKKKKR